jgi:DNA-binding MarR family transcriptional regulator
VEASTPSAQRGQHRTGACAGGAAAAPDPALRQAIELLFFAYRDFTGDADTVLAGYGFGRAHHRVIYFVGRRPGITVGELLAILEITKQSLARVLGQLMREGFVVQRTDAGDRRRRRLYLTATAEALERTLTERQSARLAAAWASAGDAAASGFRAVLRAMIDPEDRGRFAGP